jgi:hypothetical protein
VNYGSSTVDIHCDDGVTAGQRDQIDTWIHMHDADDIDTIVVGARVVAVHSLSKRFGLTGTAVRRGGLVDELDEALAIMRRTRAL